MASYGRGRNEWAVGLIALAGVVLFFVIFMLLTDRGFAEHRSVLYVHLPAAERLKKGDNVLYLGVPVGQVRSTDFAVGGGVLVSTRLRRRVPLTEAASARLVSVGVFGDQVIVLEAGSRVSRPLESGDTIRGAIADGLANRIAGLGEQAERLLADTTILLLQHALSATAGAGVELQGLMATADTVLGTKTGQLERAITHTAELTAGLSRMVGSGALQTTVDRLEAASAGLSETTRNLADASRSLSSILAKIDSGQGSAGRLVNDPGLYDRVTMTLTSLEALVTDVKHNPKRYLSVSVF